MKVPTGRAVPSVCIPAAAMTILMFAAQSVCNAQEHRPQPLIRRKRVFSVLEIDTDSADDVRHTSSGLMMEGTEQRLGRKRHDVASQSRRHRRTNKHNYGVGIDDIKDIDQRSPLLVEPIRYERFMEDASLSMDFSLSMEFSLSMDFSFSLEFCLSMSGPSGPTPKPPTPSPPNPLPSATPPSTPQVQPTPAPYAPTEPPVTAPTDPNVGEPTDPPVAEPTDPNVGEPTDPPVAEPTDAPVAEPTDAPVAEPTDPPVAEPTDPPVAEPTDLPVTLAPSGADCSTLPREEAMAQVVSQITDPSIFGDPSTPQGMAYEWMLDTDPAQVDPCTFPTVQQRYALTTLYYSTNGDGWTNSMGWLSGSNECMWAGITCEVDVVNEILLGEFNYSCILDGSTTAIFSTKSPCMANLLHSLTPLHLFYFCLLRNALVANGLSGVLPNEIQAFRSLQVLQLGNNAIGGTIPDVLIETPDLRIFDIEINAISGPAIVNLEGLGKLESYRVSANRLSGTLDPAVSSVVTLKELWMSDNQLTGEIPSSLGNLVNLETLYLYRNALAGSLPSTIGQLSSLTELQVFQNLLTGSIPEDIYRNTNLELLRLDLNGFVGTISESIGSLIKMGDLRLDENLFSGTLPASLVGLSSVGMFEFFDVSGHILNDKSCCSSFLTRFFLLALPLSIVVFRVNDNNLIGSIPDGFDQWSSLDFADFRNNQFEGPLPASIFGVPSIRILYFSNNLLAGTIPANYGSSPVLRDLFLSGNDFTGTIPEIQMGQLPELTEFLLDDNKLTGTMAESICNLRVSGQGKLDDLWADCSPDADPGIECNAPECCTACFPS
jgi:Leucine-rich repeat (LRR) protein